MFLAKVISFVLISYLTDIRCEAKVNASEASLRLKTILQNYDKKTRPNLNGPPVTVSYQIHVIAFGPVDDKTFTYGVEFYNREWWQDDRLVLGDNLTIVMNVDPRELIWVPDIVFANARKTVSHTLTTVNMRLKIGPKGNVYFSIRLSLNVFCEMNLRNFPMDTQHCPLTIESYSFSRNDIILKWKNATPPVSGFEKGFSIDSYYISKATVSEKEIHFTTTDEYFDSLIATFMMERNILFFVFNYYFPGLLLVIFTCTSFWIPFQAVPARVALLVTNFLSMTLLLQKSTKEIVKLPYRTMLEIYYMVNICFVVAAMFQYVIVLHVQGKWTENVRKKNAKKRKPNEHIMGQKNPSFKTNDDDTIQTINNPLDSKISTVSGNPPVKIDRYAKIIFPTSYSIFLIVYIFCMHLLNDKRNIHHH